ncbi:glycosyltransferase family 39 protein [Paenibacillus hodogayensis]|uniref:Glycosyltransferase family 39 protein n=1 Tax=Paenibacillus hodogayensis TaxID=279208 RepID=A0ABV5W7U4_9BACL
MHPLLRKFKYWDFILLPPLLSLSLWIRLRYFFYLKTSGKGFPDAADSQWYLSYARSLMSDFSIGAHMNDIMYFGYNLLLTVLLALFKDPVAVLFIQAVTAGLSLLLVYQIARMLFNRTTAVVASLIYAYSWDITLWSTYILTDSFFISLLLLCVYFLLKSLDTGKRTYKVLFALTAVYMCIFRPTGILSLFCILIYLFIRMDKGKALLFVKKHRYVIGTAAVAVIALFAGLLLTGKLNPLIASLQLNAKMVLYNVYAKGWIYDHASPNDHFFRPNYQIDIGDSLIASFLIHNWDHVLVLYARRAVAFLGRWVWTTDLNSLGGIKRFAYDMLPVVMFVVGTVAVIVQKRFKQASIVWLTVLSIFIFCIVVFVDGMYRYRAPSIPFIAIAVAYGADSCIRVALMLIRKAGKLLSRHKITGMRTRA